MNDKAKEEELNKKLRELRNWIREYYQPLIYSDRALKHVGDWAREERLKLAKMKVRL